MRVARGANTAAAALILASSLALADPPKPTRPAPSRYRSYVNHWHTPDPEGRVAVDEHGRPKLVLVSLNTSDRVELAAASDLGGFDASELDRAAFALREPSSGNAHPLEPRLVDLAYRVQTHFAAQEIRFISAYRTPRRRKNASNHGRGRAIDLVVPGAGDGDVAKFARELGFVGVGIYPAGGFVHIDVRDRSYFWVDGSAPGRRNREKGILQDLATKSDAAAAARGERRVDPFSIATDVDAALRERLAEPRAPDADDDDDSDGSSDG